MYLVPILHLAQAGTDLTKIWVFLERNGNHLIQVDDMAAAQAFSAENGLTTVGDPVQVGDCIFLHVDSSSKDLNLFYTWRETPPGTLPLKEVWRPFLWISDKEGKDPLGVNQLLDGISLGEQSAYSVLNAWHTVRPLTTP